MRSPPRRYWPWRSSALQDQVQRASGIAATLGTQSQTTSRRSIGSESTSCPAARMRVGLFATAKIAVRRRHDDVIRCAPCSVGPEGCHDCARFPASDDKRLPPRIQLSRIRIQKPPLHQLPNGRAGGLAVVDMPTVGGRANGKHCLSRLVALRNTLARAGEVRGDSSGVAPDDEPDRDHHQCQEVLPSIQATAYRISLCVRCSHPPSEDH